MTTTETERELLRCRSLGHRFRVVVEEAEGHRLYWEWSGSEWQYRVDYHNPLNTVTHTRVPDEKAWTTLAEVAKYERR